jgi:hypothetical protein
MMLEHTPICGCREKSNAEQMIKMRAVLSKKLSLLDRNIRDEK